MILFTMKNTCCFLFFICISLLVSGQQKILDSLQNKFNTHRKSALQEKVYVHTNNNVYLTGEYLWLKAYLVDGSLHKPLDLSKVVYIELVDKNNAAVLQAKIHARQGKGDAALFLPASLESGSYFLRAYTNWMKNFRPDYYFHKPITLINTFEKLEPTLVARSKSSYDIQFFPEGGNLIHGITSKVAFKITNLEGNGLDYSGVLLANEKDTLLTFKPYKFGMGHFNFIPLRENSYKVRVIDNQGNTKDHSFPEIQESGYAMQLRDSSEQYLSLTVTAENISHSRTAAYLFVHSRNITTQAKFNYLEQNKATFLISKIELPEGISHFTIFDNDLKPVCERLYFKPVSKKLDIKVQHDRSVGIRRKVNLQLALVKANEEKVKGNLSVSVYKLDSLSTRPTHGILEYLWLESDLQGTIENSQYYFSNQPDVKVVADNLMLTQGWRRFNWEQVLTGKKSGFEFLPECQGHLISGKILSKNNEPASYVLSYLSSPDKIIRFYSGRSNAIGNVMFQTQTLFGSRKLIFQTENRDQYLFHLESPFSKMYCEKKFPRFALTRVDEKSLLDRSIAMQIQNIYHDDKFEYKQAVRDTLPFYGKPDNSYLLDDYTRFPLLEEVMREYVPGVRVRNRKDGFHFLVEDRNSQLTFEEDALVLLDGVPASVNKIMDFSPLKIKKLDVIERKYYLGPLTLSGIVSFSTYAADLGGFELDTETISINYEGLQQQREFYSPAYPTENERKSRIPDQRNLLYWNGDVNTNDAGISETHFYSSDVTGNFIIVVEGITADGFAGRLVSDFLVKDFNN
jgi:hypothetical protein